MAAYLTRDELKTHLYQEITNEIVRDDNTITDDAISTAIEEAKGYLTKYDIVAIFSDPLPNGRNKKLLSIVKDVAAWHLIRLSNPNIELPLKRVMYEDAVRWLERVQAGKIDPLLPYPEVPEPPMQNPVRYSSNPKRTHHF